MVEWLLLIAAILATMPVRVSVRIDINRAPTFLVVVYLYGARMSFEGALSDRGRVALKRPGGKAVLSAPARALIFFWYQLFVVSFFSRAEAECRVGTGDACTTALAATVLAELLKALGQAVRLRVSVRPEFSRAFFALKARCILSMRGGDIIVAAIRTVSSGRTLNRKAENAHGAASN